MNINAKKTHSIGERLEILTRAKGLTRYKLSKTLDLSNTYILGLNKGEIKRGGIKFWNAIHQQYPEWEAYLRGDVDEPPLRIEQKIRRNDVEESLIKLTALVPIPMDIDLTFEQNIANWIGLKLYDVIFWLETNNIPDDIVDAIAQRGYPPKKWLLNRPKPQGAELSFKRLAILNGISIDSGWLHHLSEAIKYDGIEITLAIFNDKVTQELIDHVEKSGFPPEKWLANSQLTTDKQINEISSPITLLKVADKILHSNTQYAKLLSDYINTLSKTMDIEPRGFKKLEANLHKIEK